MSHCEFGTCQRLIDKKSNISRHKTVIQKDNRIARNVSQYLRPEENTDFRRINPEGESQIQTNVNWITQSRFWRDLECGVKFGQQLLVNTIIWVALLRWASHTHARTAT